MICLKEIQNITYFLVDGQFFIAFFNFGKFPDFNFGIAHFTVEPLA